MDLYEAIRTSWALGGSSSIDRKSIQDPFMGKIAGKEGEKIARGKIFWPTYLKEENVFPNPNRDKGKEEKR
jgi:hypothetical protein